MAFPPAVMFTSDPSSTSVAPSRRISLLTVIVRFNSVSPVASMSKFRSAARLPTDSSRTTPPAPPSIVRSCTPAVASLIVPVTRRRSAAPPPVVIVTPAPAASTTTLSSITMLPPVEVTSDVKVVRFAATVPGPVPVNVMPSLTSTVLEYS